MIALLAACHRDPPGPPPAGVDIPAPTGETGSEIPAGTTGSTGDTGGLPPPGPCGVALAATSIAGPDDDDLQVFAFGSAGDAWVGGYFRGTLTLGAGTPAETSVTSEAYGGDGLVTHFAADGSFEWARRVSSTESAWVESLAPGGGFAVGAAYGPFAISADAPDEVGYDSLGEADAWVARWDSDGGLLWTARMGGAGHDFPLAAAPLPDGSVLVVGHSDADAAFGAGEPGEVTLTLPPYAFDYSWVARLDSDGRLVWVEPAGGTEYADVEDAALDPVTGELVVVGTANGPGVVTFPGDPPIAFDPVGPQSFLARWSPDGGATSVRAMGGYPEDLAVLADGSALVAGEFYGEMVFGAGEPNETKLATDANSDAFVARYAPDGSLVFATGSRSAASHNAWGRGVAPTPDGGAVLVGDFANRIRFGDGEAHQTDLKGDGDAYDAYVARFEPDGALRCAVRVASRGYELGTAVALRDDGTFTTLTTSTGDPVFAPESAEPLEATGVDGDDAWLATWQF